MGNFIQRETDINEKLQTIDHNQSRFIDKVPYCNCGYKASKILYNETVFIKYPHAGYCEGEYYWTCSRMRNVGGYLERQCNYIKKCFDQTLLYERIDLNKPAISPTSDQIRLAPMI